MPTQTDVQLTAAATVIQNEVAANANTATRVGTILNNIVENKINNDKIVISVTGASDANVASEKAVKTYADTKQAALGFTAENVANKDTDVALAANSDVKYPSQKAVKTYADTKQAALGFTPENVANKDTDVTLAANSDTKYSSQKAVKAYVDSKAFPKIYTGIFEQLGTSVPTVALAANTIGSVVFTRNSIGSYTGTLAGAFTAGKTTVIPTIQDVHLADKTLLIYSPTADTLSISSRKISDGTFVDFNQSALLSIEIKVYP